MACVDITQLEARCVEHSAKAGAAVLSLAQD
jgi:hypothetical protein